MLSDYRTFWRARESVLDARLRLPDDRGVAHIVDDLQDAIAGHRPAKGPRRDQAGRAPRWRLLEARRPGVDIIAGASLAPPR